MPHATSSPMATLTGGPTSEALSGVPTSTSPAAPTILPGKLPILMVGLPPHHPSLVGRKPAHEVAAGLAMVQKKFDASPHYALTQHLTSPEDSLQRYIEVLQSQPWRGLVIGFGVRGSMELTRFFEDLVRLAQVHAPQARFCFNAGLPDTLDSVARNVPVEMAEAASTTKESDEEPVAVVVKVVVPPKEPVQGPVSTPKQVIPAGNQAKDTRPSKPSTSGTNPSKSEKRKSFDWRRVLR